MSPHETPQRTDLKVRRDSVQHDSPGDVTTPLEMALGPEAKAIASKSASTTAKSSRIGKSRIGKQPLKWSAEEEAILDKANAVGLSNAAIAAKLPGRTPSAVKMKNYHARKPARPPKSCNKTPTETQSPGMGQAQRRMENGMDATTRGIADTDVVRKGGFQDSDERSQNSDNFHHMHDVEAVDACGQQR